MVTTVPVVSRLRREVRRGGRRESRKEEGDPTGLAPAEVFFTGAVGHLGRRRYRPCGVEREGREEMGVRVSRQPVGQGFDSPRLKDSRRI
jgi:hypothetical protein